MKVRSCGRGHGGPEGRAVTMRNRIPKEQIELLRAVPLFSGCSESELRSIAKLGHAC